MMFIHLHIKQVCVISSYMDEISEFHMKNIKLVEITQALHLVNKKSNLQSCNVIV